jgi:hypothetical protein
MDALRFAGLQLDLFETAKNLPGRWFDGAKIQLHSLAARARAGIADV